GRVMIDDEHRSLLKELLGRFRAAWRWKLVLAIAGHQRVEIANELLSVLLEAGYIKLVERRDVRGWQPVRIIPIKMRELRVVAGMQDREEMLAAIAEALKYETRTVLTNKLQLHLDSNRLDVKLRRARLLPLLEDWLKEGKSGTRRDFALFATGHTTGAEDADWRWLEAHQVLEAAGIVEHVPLVLAGGTFVIVDPQRRTLDTSIARGPIGLPASAIMHAVRSKPPSAWIIFENRTVFDKACALLPNIGLLCVPGYAPTWWLDAVAALLDRLAAPAVIACDPDPAGIEIAARVIALWEKRTLAWRVVGMGAAALEALPAHTRAPLSVWDRNTLTR